MSYFRSYFEKNNTITENSLVNTARYPATDIFYGNGYSKFLFKVDFTELKNRVNSGEYLINSGTTHTLRMVNTIFGDEALLGDYNATGKQRATSFDLILFVIPEFWDEGVGFDYEKTYDASTGQALFDIRPSNWYNRTSLYPWTITGVYSNSPTILQTIHFDLGSENLNVDITNYVNGIILSGNTDYGLGLAFSVPYTEISLDVAQSVAFFTKYTQTFYEPFVESYFDDVIKDSRYNFVENKVQSLYLYVTKGTNFFDLDYNPTVDILDSTKTPVPGLTGLTTNKVRMGVYEVTFGLNGISCDGKKFFYDQWNNINIEGNTVGTITQRFIPKPFTALYNIGENPTELQRYAIQFYGVKYNEKINQGDIRKVVVTFRSIDQQTPVLLDEVYYRIFVYEGGSTEVTVFDWTLMDTTNENSFYFDTSFMIPREYFLEIKAKTNSEWIFYKDSINFEIVSEK
jgi:hypothetical protein